MDGLKRGLGTIVGDDVVLGNRVQLGYNCIVEEGVVLGDDVFVDSNTIIRSGTSIGDKAFIGSNCIIGEYQLDFCVDRRVHAHKLTIGPNALIRSGSVVYTGSRIGSHFETGHHAVIREGATIGSHVRFGTFADVQGDCVVGDYVRAHSNVHISQQSIIDSFVWLFPYVLLTNDPMPPSENVAGSHICSFAVIASRAVIMPGVVVGQDALVAANAQVSKDVEPYSVVSGAPAKRVCDIGTLNAIAGEKRYPWRNHFDRGMPWKDVGFSKWVSDLEDEDYQRLGFERVILS